MLPLALPFSSPSFFHTISLSPAFTSREGTLVLAHALALEPKLSKRGVERPKPALFTGSREGTLVLAHALALEPKLSKRGVDRPVKPAPCMLEL
jgi:hypothetical protein